MKNLTIILKNKTNNFAVCVAYYRTIDLKRLKCD